MAKKKQPKQEGRSGGVSREEAEKYGGFDEFGGAGQSGSRGKGSESASTLKDLLDPDVLAKLKNQAAEMKVEEEKAKEAVRKKAEAARKAEQERLDNDFSHLLGKSDPNWRNFK